MCSHDLSPQLVVSETHQLSESQLNCYCGHECLFGMVQHQKRGSQMSCFAIL